MPVPFLNVLVLGQLQDIGTSRSEQESNILLGLARRRVGDLPNLLDRSSRGAPLVVVLPELEMRSRLLGDGPASRAGDRAAFGKTLSSDSRVTWKAPPCRVEKGSLDARSKPEPKARSPADPIDR